MLSLGEKYFMNRFMYFLLLLHSIKGGILYRSKFLEPRLKSDFVNHEFKAELTLALGSIEVYMADQ